MFTCSKPSSRISQGGLLELKQPRRVSGELDQDQESLLWNTTVQLMHQSAKEFLLENSRIWMVEPPVDPIKQCHFKLAKACLEFLRLDGLPQGPPSSIYGSKLPRIDTISSSASLKAGPCERTGIVMPDLDA
jgi:hypothetical protein